MKPNIILVNTGENTTWLRYRIVLLLGVVLLIGIGYSSYQKNKKQATPSVNTDVKSPESAWQYTSTRDQMSSGEINIATLVSNNELYFDFPYNGGSRGVLVLQHKDNINTLQLIISKGQFMTGVYGGRIRMRFNNNESLDIKYRNSSDGSADRINILLDKELLRHLLYANNLRVEAEFYREGKQILEFNLYRLDWNY